MPVLQGRPSYDSLYPLYSEALKCRDFFLDVMGFKVLNPLYLSYFSAQQKLVTTSTGLLTLASSFNLQSRGIKLSTSPFIEVQKFLERCPNQGTPPRELGRKMSLCWSSMLPCSAMFVWNNFQRTSLTTLPIFLHSP